MIKRDYYLTSLATATERSPVTALLGPRQSGKITFARIFGKDRTAHYFDLESPADQQRLQNPELMFRARPKITLHFKRRSILPDCVTKTYKYLDIPTLSRLASQAPQHLKLPIYFWAKP